MNMMIRRLVPEPVCTGTAEATGSPVWRSLLATIAAILEDSAIEIDVIGARLVGDRRDGHVLQGLDLQRQKLIGLARALQMLEAHHDQPDEELRTRVIGAVHLEALRRELFGEPACSMVLPVELF